MKTATLTRDHRSKTGTLGRLEGEGLSLYTVELPWLDNAPRRSCIPAGRYRIRRRKFHKGNYMAVEVCDVPGRTTILFHRANHPRELLGCIGPGLDRDLKAESATSSRLALDKLLEWLGDDEAELVVVWTAKTQP